MSFPEALIKHGEGEVVGADGHGVAGAEPADANRDAQGGIVANGLR
jgi:hypothetical protein